MPIRPARSVRRIRSILRTQLAGPQVLAFLPALMLAAYWIGGQTALLFMALIVPGLFAFGGLFGRGNLSTADVRDTVTNLPHRMTVVHAVDAALPEALASGRSAAAMAAAVDNYDDAVRDLNDPDRDAVLAQVADRVRSALRDSDRVARLEGARFAIALTSIRKDDHAMMDDISRRLQSFVSEPISVSGQRIHLTLSVGYCLPGKLSRATGDTIVEAAEAALAVARGQGGGAVSSFDPAMPATGDYDETAVDDLIAAMDAGQIEPWFQPQIDAETGAIIGFEALARWRHPKRGIVMPADFLPLVEPAGLSRRLGEVILYASFTLLRSLDRQNLSAPKVAVNFSHAELSAPDLADRLKWELDRFDLSPERLTIEVLETAIARDTAAVERNLRSLAQLGCGIDLDDFGTGNTSIAGVRRFAVHRLKIDRSFVAGIDHDRDQIDMVRAILTMARQLGLETIAEGVETLPEQTALSALGCDAIQGFVIARPMPADEVAQWITAYMRKLGISNATELQNRAIDYAPQGKTA